MRKPRYEFLDHIKAVAVILMVNFHLFYDLNLFQFISIQPRKDFFWYIQPKIIITIFLVSVGMNLSIVHEKVINWEKFNKRIIKLLVVAVSISFVTYFIFPGRWIYFGILHNIAASSFLALIFLKYPRISLLIGVALLAPSVLYDYKYPFISLSKRPVDHVALFPWFGCVLVGIYLKSRNIHLIKIPDYRFKPLIRFLGRYTLEIYILHQLFLFSLIFLLHKFFH